MFMTACEPLVVLSELKYVFRYAFVTFIVSNHSPVLVSVFLTVDIRDTAPALVLLRQSNCDLATADGSKWNITIITLPMILSLFDTLISTLEHYKLDIYLAKSIFVIYCFD